ncbi:MAG TPA: UvrD-helicase domain-containing protein [Gemmatimonadaceae bacterium]|nr:UvrD-helicase domain-containing protein [Gemmatimonadaceae bacterium]
MSASASRFSALEPFDALVPPFGAVPGRVPSPSQRAAIEAPAEALLVLAGPGAGKTFCLIERIRFLLERLGMEPARICAFTFTNKAAGEIAERLSRTLGDRARQVKTGTIHAFCAELLREFGSRVGLQKNFQIIDADQQVVVLRRIGKFSYQKPLLARISAHRIANEPFTHRSDARAFEKYERFLLDRNYADFDTLIIKTAELLAHDDVVQRVRARWDCVLVDEFQDLNPLQYQVIRALGREHGHVFAVGDDEQSIYSWAGADPKVFLEFSNDFEVRRRITLRENRRCSREILALARRLIEHNPTLFDEPKLLEAERESDFCVSALTFRDDAAERDWLVADLGRDRAEHGIAWGDVALLYRTHAIGDALEGSLLAAGIPCRLANGRALAQDPIIAYVLAALQVVAHPDDVHDDAYFECALNERLVGDARAKLPRTGRTLRQELEATARELGREHPDAKRIRKACYSLDNLPAIASQHTTVMGLVEELLSHRVGTYDTVLEENHDELTDPAALPEVTQLAARLTDAREAGRTIWLERRRGVEIPLAGLLRATGFHRVSIAPVMPPDAEPILVDDAPTLGLPLALCKALQLLACTNVPSSFRDFTVVDIETTSKDVDTTEVVEIAAVRVRGRTIVDELHALVRPEGAIDADAARVHGITDAEVAGAPTFAEVWPRIRAFCGTDTLVAHNGHHFDFPILERLSGETLAGTYDTLPLARRLCTGSGSLPALAEHFKVDRGRSHRALDDTRALAKVFLALRALNEAFARKTALAHLLDYVAVALVLWPDELDTEGAMLRDRCSHFAFGRFSSCLDEYDAQRSARGDDSLPSVQDLIEWLGGAERMERVRAEKPAGERYPVAMGRLRALLDQLPQASFDDQLCRLLELAALSRADDEPADATRVNLLTLHSTKGLEFSRVYVVGVEDAEMIGGTAAKPATGAQLEEARRLLYVGMTRAKDRLVLTHVRERGERAGGGHRFLDEMGLVPDER